MNNFFGNKETKALDTEIERLVTTLSGMSSTQDEYTLVAENLRLLCEVREKKNPTKLNIDTILNASVNMLGLLMILNFEKTGVITSRAIGFLWKGKS